MNELIYTNFYNKLPNNEKYIQFIIDNYNDDNNNKLVYTKEHFKCYFSKQICNDYELFFIENDSQVLCSSVVIKENKVFNTSKYDYYYINFACVHKNFRDQGYLVSLTKEIIKKYSSIQNCILYGLTFRERIHSELNLIKQFQVFNVKVQENKKKIDGSKKYILYEPFTSLSLTDFYIQKNKIGDFKNSCLIAQFPSSSKFYKYYSFLDKETLTSNHLILYNLQLYRNNQIINNYYIVESTKLLDQFIIQKLINKLEPNSFLNVPEYLLNGIDSIKTFSCYSTQECKVLLINGKNKEEIENLKDNFKIKIFKLF